MFEVYRSDKSDDYYFRLKAANGQVILSSQAYKEKAGCLKGVESVKANAADESRFEIKEASNGKQFFNLMAANGQVVGTSQMYADGGSLRKGIASVQSNAPGADVADLTAKDA